MKENIHPPYHTLDVTCGCGNRFSLGTTLEKGSLHIEVCNACHPFYTGKQKIVTAGRVEKMMKKFGIPSKQEEHSETGKTGSSTAKKAG